MAARGEEKCGSPAALRGEPTKRWNATQPCMSPHLPGDPDRPKHGTHQLPRSRRQPGNKSFSSVHTVGPTV
ncbi:unnamed protein product [Musa acuminata subsp. burmannicoides]